MPLVHVNGTDLYYTSDGEGPALVLVHGGWSDHDNWAAVAPSLARSFQVVTYDRRGHGQSPRPSRPATRRDQEDDLAALIEALELGPANVVGTSFGASIAIGLATRRPALVASLMAHEPPLLSLVADEPELEPLVAATGRTIESVLERLARGQVEAAARQFIEEIALGPGGWEQLPAPIRETAVRGAGAFADEQRDADWAAIDRSALAQLEMPVCVTQGDRSPQWFYGIVAALADAVGRADVRTFGGAGHAPHLSHPDDFVAGVSEFVHSEGRAPAWDVA